MELYTLMILFCIISYNNISSNTPNKCDITIWHMGVMEHLLTQETEMTQRQKSTLEKAEQLIQRVVKNGGSPLVNCGLLDTYSYNLVPEFSSQLMDMTIRESEDKNDDKFIKEQSSNDVKAASRAHDDGDSGPIHDTSDNSKEDDSKVKNDYSDKKGIVDKRIDEQLDAKNSDNDVHVMPAVADNDVFADKRDMTGDDADRDILDDKQRVDKEPVGRTTKDDSHENENTEPHGDNMKTADRNHNDEFPDYISENNSTDDRSVLNDPDSNKDGVRDDEGNDLQDKSVESDVIKEKDSLDSKLYNEGKSDMHKMWEPEDENYDDSEEEDCYYRSNDELVCTRKSRDHSSKSEINKIINGHNERVDVHSEENKAENIVRDDKTKRINRDFRGEQNEINSDGNKVKELDKDIHGHTEENIDASTNIFGFDEGDSEYKDVNIDTTYNNKMVGEDIDKKKDKNNNTDNDDDKIKSLNQDNSKDESEYVDNDDILAGFIADGKENKDKTIGVKIKPTDTDSYETGSDDTYTPEENGIFNESRNVANKEHVKINERDALEDSVIGRDDKDERNVDDTLETSNASDKTHTRVDNGHLVVQEKNIGNVDNDDQQMKSLLNGDENDVNEHYSGDGGSSFQEHVASATSKDNKDDLDKSRKKEVSNQEADQSSDMSNTVIAKGNDNGDGIVIFYDDDENDDKEENQMYGTESHDTSSKDNEDIKSVTQKRISDRELKGSDRNKNLDDKDNEYNIDDNNSETTNIAGDQHQDVTNGKQKFDPSIDTTKQSNFLKQSSDDSEEITESKKEKIDRSADNKRDKDSEKISGKHKNTERKVISEETSYQGGQTLEGTKTIVSNDNSGHTTLDIKQLELIFAQRESEQAEKIQKLELMLFKLENKILTQSVDKQSDTNAFISLENQILKLENELMKLSENYRQLLRDHDTLKSQQRKSYLELEHIKTSPPKSEYPALADNSTSEMIKQQKTRITELSKMIHNQSATAQMLQSRSQYLEEENRKLFQVVLNQSALISNIMKKLDELGEEGLKTRTQTEDFKAQLETFKQPKTLKQATLKDQTSLKRPAYEIDFGMDSSVTTTPPAQSKDLVSIVFWSFRKSPTARSPSGMFDIRWRCGGLNSTRLCLFHSLIVSNCTPFNDLQWKSCKQAPGSLLLERSDEIVQKHGDHVLVRLPSEGQVPEVKHGEALTAEESSMHVQPGEGSNGDVGTQNNDRGNEVKPSAVSMLDDNKHGASRRSAEVELDSKTSTHDAFKSELDELPTMKSTSDDELSRNDGGENRADSLNNILDLIHNDKTDAIGAQNDEGKKRLLKVTAFDQSKDNKHNGVMFKGGDDDTFDKESKSKDNIESSIEQDTNNNSHQDSPLQTENSAAPSGVEATATSLCEHNDRSQECSSNVAQTSKTSSDTRTARPELREQIQLNDLNIDKNDANTKVDHSTLKHAEHAAEVKLLDGKMRKKAAEEAMKTHEALYRKILYKPIYDNRPKDCYDLHKRGQERDGMSQVFISGMNVYVSVFCDMTAGGWTTLLKREDGLIDFYRNYEQYKEGFGGHPRTECHVGDGAGICPHCPPKKVPFRIRVDYCSRLDNQRLVIHELSVMLVMALASALTVLQKRSPSESEWTTAPGWTISDWGEHYVGNEVIHHLTNQGHYSLKVELTDWNGTTKHAYYDHFWVDGEEEDFRLHLFGYSGDAGDGLGKHSSMKFSTFDVDNDILNTEMGGSCAKRFQGAGWYYKCYSSNLMGRYYTGGEVPEKRFDGVAWKPWRGPGYSLKTVVLAVRPFGAE